MLRQVDFKKNETFFHLTNQPTTTGKHFFLDNIAPCYTQATLKFFSFSCHVLVYYCQNSFHFIHSFHLLVVVDLFVQSCVKTVLLLLHVFLLSHSFLTLFSRGIKLELFLSLFLFLYFFSEIVLINVSL